MQKATTLEKSSNDIVRLTISRRFQQPIQQQPPPASSVASSGNFRAPASSKFSTNDRPDSFTSDRRVSFTFYGSSSPGRGAFRVYVSERTGDLSP
ncbi:hypothetical protein X777_02394 [Ooceraea biroi]|uniref:Uncharacterized protein n=1 Tax=Ooceraea biroi TaxID=2015173 RepID=A0A026WN48_OOCBI|nr:hypothetical protein X777_02394 [Ooceraea biroi]